MLGGQQKKKVSIAPGRALRLTGASAPQRSENKLVGQDGAKKKKKTGKNFCDCGFTTTALWIKSPTDFCAMYLNTIIPFNCHGVKE